MVESCFRKNQPLLASQISGSYTDFWYQLWILKLYNVYIRSSDYLYAVHIGLYVEFDKNEVRLTKL